MAKYKLDDRARTDLDKIITYIEQHNALASVEFEEDIYNSCEFLANNPFVGRKRPEFTDKPFRFWVVWDNYLIAYSIEENIVVIHAILHAARDIGRLLQ